MGLIKTAEQRESSLGCPPSPAESASGDLNGRKVNDLVKLSELRRYCGNRQTEITDRTFNMIRQSFLAASIAAGLFAACAWSFLAIFLTGPVYGALDTFSLPLLQKMKNVQWENAYNALEPPVPPTFINRVGRYGEMTRVVLSEQKKNRSNFVQYADSKEIVLTTDNVLQIHQEYLASQMLRFN